MTRAKLEAYALELGWAVNQSTSDSTRTTFGRDGCRISVWYSEQFAAPCFASARDQDGRLEETNCGSADSTDEWTRKRLRELAGVYTPPPSLLDTVAEAVDPDDEHPDLADLPTVEGER